MAVAQSNIELIPEKDLQSTARLYENIEKINSALIAQAKLIQGMPKFPSSPNDTPATEPRKQQAALEAEINRLYAVRAKALTQMDATTKEIRQNTLNTQEIRKRDLVLERAIAKEQAAEVGSLERAQKALSRMLIEQGRINRSTAEGKALYDQMGAEITDQYNLVSKLEQKRGDFGRQVGNYSKTFNGLQFQIQQVARELPTLAMSPTLFINAIGNNLPMLQDEIIRTKAEIAKLNDEGKSSTPIWKQAWKSILSPQTLLIAGITLFAMYSDEIFTWIGNLIKGGEQALTTAEAMDELNKTMDFENLGKQRADFEKLVQLYAELGDNAEAKQKFIQEYREELDATGVSVLSVIDADNLLIQNTGAFIEAMTLRARATAAQTLASKEYEEAIKVEIKNAPEREKLVRRLSELQAKSADYTETTTVAMQGMAAGTSATLSKSRAELISETADAIRALDKEDNVANNNADTYTRLSTNLSKSATALERHSGFVQDEVSWLARLQSELDAVQKQYVAEGDVAGQTAKNKRIKELQDEINRLQSLGIEKKKQKKADDDGHRQRMGNINAELKAIEDLTTDEIEQEQWRLKNTISAKDTSIAERTIAMERYYNLEEQRIKELARVQKENLIQKNIDENTMVDKSGKVVSTISPEQAAKNVATQLLVIDTALQHKLEQNTYDRTQAQQEYENEAIEFAIRGAQRRMQAEMNAVDQQESDDLLALAQDRNRNLLMSDAEYEDKKTAIQRAAADKRNQIGLDELNNQLELLMSDPNKTEAEDEAILDLQQKIADEEVRINKEKNERIAEDDDTADERRRDAINQIASYIKDMYNSLLQARKNATEAELEDLDKQGEAAEDAADEEQERIARLEENGAISKEEADARRAQSEDTLAAKQAEIDAQRAQVQRRQAEFEKQQAIAQAVIGTAQAVVKTYSQFGFTPWGIAAAIAAGLAGAAQIAVISAQKIPEYATGTDFHKGGLAVVGDGGRHEAILSGGRLYKSPAVPSLVDMPTGAQVLPDYNIALRDMILNGQINSANAHSLTPMKVEAHLNSERMEAAMVDMRRETREMKQAFIRGFGVQQSRSRRAALMNKRIYKINDKK